MARSRHTQRKILIRALRSLAGFLVAAGLLRLAFWAGHVLPGWLIPFLLLAGALTAWVAGPPAGWVVAAIYLWLWSALGFVGDFLTFGPVYAWNVMAVIRDHEVERFVFTLYLSAVVTVGGLFGWWSSTLVAWLYKRSRTK